MIRLRLDKVLSLLCLLSSGMIMLISLPTNAQETASEIKRIATQSPVESVVPMLLGLLSILAVIFGLAFILKRFTHLNPAAGNIKVLETQRLGAKERLVIVEVQEQQILLGVTPQNISQLAELKRPIETIKNATSFESLMKQMLNPTELIKAKSGNNNQVKSESKQQINPDDKLKDKTTHSSIKQKYTRKNRGLLNALANSIFYRCTGLAAGFCGRRDPRAVGRDKSKRKPAV